VTHEFAIGRSSKRSAPRSASKPLLCRR